MVRCFLRKAEDSISGGPKVSGHPVEPGINLMRKVLLLGHQCSGIWDGLLKIENH